MALLAYSFRGPLLSRRAPSGAAVPVGQRASPRQAFVNGRSYELRWSLSEMERGRELSGGQQQGGGEVFQMLEDGDPRAVAGYLISARLGAGGMGKVYLSYTPGGRPVAIKVIRPEFSEDAEFRRRFRQEAEAAQRVQGLYTAPVIDCDTEGAQPWLATAYVPGPSLAAAVAAHGPLPVPTVLLLVAGIAEALHVIHGAGIVHRDLKPSNVLLAADGPRVIDFGIARAADATSLTGSGVTIGTPAFMAPEQAAGRSVTAATDIFALGQVAAYAALASPAFGEGTGHGVLYRIVHEEPELLGLPSALRELVTRCLAKNPSERPSVTDVIGLCQAANSETVLRRPEDWLPRPVADDITVRAAAPAPARTVRPPEVPPAATAEAGQPPTQPPASASAPGFGQPLAAPPYQPPAVAPSVAPVPTVYAAPATPPGFGPPTPLADSGPQPPLPQHGAPGAGPYQPSGPQAQFPQQPGSYGYPAHTGYQGAAAAPFGQTGVVPGSPQGSGAPQAPAPARKKSRTLAVTLAIALVFGVVGAGSAYFVLRGGDGTTAQQDDQPENKHKQSQSPDNSSSPSPGPSGSKGGSTTPIADPTPADYPGINLTAGYHLDLGDDPVKPQEGEDDNYDFVYSVNGWVEAKRDGGKLVLLDPGEEGSLATCRDETRFTTNIELDKLSKGSQICLHPGTGNLGLITVQGMSSEDSPSTYLKIDLTVWRNAVQPAPVD